MKLPDKLKAIKLEHKKAAPIGFSQDKVYIIDKGFNGKDIVLKMSSRKEVYEEGVNYQWLQNKIKVPKIYFNVQEDGMYYLVMEKLPGVMFQELFQQYDTKEVVELYAKLLKEFHAIDYHGLPYQHSLTDKLLEAKYNVEHHLVRTQYFEREFQGKNAKHLYQRLCNIKVEESDLVLCHGDVCMPNIIMDQKELSGFIDISGIGVLDRYYDIAIALRTLRYNFELYHLDFNEEMISIFCKCYGMEVLDVQKLEYYILLDELMI